MEFNLNYQSVLLLFFFLQGLVFAVLLFINGRRYQQRSSTWLAAWVLLSCMYITPWMCGHAGWYARDGYREFLFFAPLQQFFFLGPIIYFYVSSLLQVDFRVAGKKWLHLLPGTLYLLYSLGLFVIDIFLLDEYYFYADGRDKDLAPWYQITGLAIMSYYLAMSLQVYRQYYRRIFDELSYADSVLFKWVRQFLMALLFIILLRLSFLVLFPEWGSFGQKWYYYVGFAALAYFIAFRGYRHAIISAHLFASSELKLDPVVVPDEGLPVSDTPSSKEQMSEQAIVEEVDPEALAKLQSLMEKERYYEEPALTLTQLAQRMDTHPKALSALINQGFGVNFNDFVNRYRVEAFQARVRAGQDAHLTLLGIALACGFNSKSTFNRVFKRHTGMRPAEFLATHKKIVETGAKS